MCRSTQAQAVTSLAGSSVSVHLRFLRSCGFLRLARPHRAHDAYRTAVLGLTAAYLAQECVYAYQVSLARSERERERKRRRTNVARVPQERADMDKLARVMFLLLCHVTSIAKQVVFYRNASAASIDAIITGLDGKDARARRWRRRGAF